MKIAITGCNGSIGRRVIIRALAQEHTVVGIDIHIPSEVEFSLNPAFSFLQVDLTDYEKITKALHGCDGVIHLAGVPQPVDYGVVAHNCNVVLSWNVLRAAAEVGITRIALASSVNVVTLAYCKEPHIKYFPIDEDHPCLPDEPYGLSKLICELQADTIVRRYPSTRIASLRFHWSVPSLSYAYSAEKGKQSGKKDLWGYVQEDSAAEACLLALADSDKWSGHEAFFIVAPRTRCKEESESLIQRDWKNIPIKQGGDMRGSKGFFNCAKAEKLLGWVHQDSPQESVLD